MIQLDIWQKRRQTSEAKATVNTHEVGPLVAAVHHMWCIISRKNAFGFCGSLFAAALSVFAHPSLSNAQAAAGSTVAFFERYSAQSIANDILKKITDYGLNGDSELPDYIDLSNAKFSEFLIPKNPIGYMMKASGGDTLVIFKFKLPNNQTASVEGHYDEKGASLRINTLKIDNANIRRSLQTAEISGRPNYPILFTRNHLSLFPEDENRRFDWLARFDIPINEFGGRLPEVAKMIGKQISVTYTDENGNSRIHHGILGNEGHGEYIRVGNTKINVSKISDGGIKVFDSTAEQLAKSTSTVQASP